MNYEPGDVLTWNGPVGRLRGMYPMPGLVISVDEKKDDIWMLAADGKVFSFAREGLSFLSLHVGGHFVTLRRASSLAEGL